MLKGLSVIIFSILVFLSFSCKKSYTCDCTWTNGATSYSESYDIKETKKKAKEECDAKQSKYIKNSKKEKIYWRCLLNK